MMTDYKISSGKERQESDFWQSIPLKTYPLRMNGETTVEIPPDAGYFRMGYDWIGFYSGKCGNCRKIPERAEYLTIRTKTRSKMEREKRWIFG